jgi:hypothetical protein
LVTFEERAQIRGATAIPMRAITKTPRAKIMMDCISMRDQKSSRDVELKKVRNKPKRCKNPTRLPTNMMKY